MHGIYILLATMEEINARPVFLIILIDICFLCSIRYQIMKCIVYYHSNFLCILFIV